MTVRTACAVVLVVAAWCRGAWGDRHPLVQLEIDPCADVPSKEVRGLITIELGPVLAESVAPTADRTRVAVVCVKDLLELRVDDPITGKSLRRTIDPREVPGARARLLALAIVELISASWTELETNPQPRVLPAGPRASPETRRAALETVREQSEKADGPRTRLVAMGGGIGFFHGPGLLGGGGVRAMQDYSRHIGWLADLQADHGNGKVSLGTVSVDALSVGAALVRSWPSIGLHLGVGMRGGAVRFRGNPNAMQAAIGSSGWAPWLGPMGLVTMSLVATHRVELDVGVESGYVVLPAGALVNGARELAVDGPWIGFHVGVCAFW